ncbi:MAG TPA: hypothetical protein PKW90_15235 [Myxococcota bacterium]|nr:hypothetical protein [Myxococcota bacterium]
MTLAEYIQSLFVDGIVVDTVRMNPPPEEGLGVTVELYPEPSPFVELFSGGNMVARVTFPL